MDWTLKRRRTAADWMFGDLEAGTFKCLTLEDEQRQVKVQGETCIPGGRYELIFENSPKFGPDTLTLVGVSGFKYIRMHSGEDDDDTDGCIIVGDRIDDIRGKISGGKLRGVLDRLKSIYRDARGRDERVFITVWNAPGDFYVDTAVPVNQVIA